MERVERVLIVEDDQRLRFSIGRLLSKLGYAISFAGDGEEALLSLDSHSADLVVLDLMLPDMDGAAVLNALRQDPRWSDLPVILISARDSSEIQARIGQNTIFAFVSKCDGGFVANLLVELRRALMPVHLADSR